MSRYRIAPAASRDLDEIADYFLGRNIDAGERLFKQFNKKCQNLARFPRIGRSYSHIKPGLRGVLLDRYIIFYRLVGENIEILRVVSGRRDLEALFANSDDR